MIGGRYLELINLKGSVFGKLKVLELAFRKNNEIFWKCKCECGSEKNVNGKHLRRGAVVSCGCHKREKTIERSTKHGDSYSRLYNIWCHMKSRCYKKNNKDYRLYGAKGIIVCDAWHDYKVFKKWAIENGYDDKKTIDRIDSNKNYCPENCRWATAEIQSNNTNRNRYIEYNGETLTMAQLSKKYKIKYETLKQRLKRGWSIEKALKTIEVEFVK